MGMKGQKIGIIAGAVLAGCLCLGGAWMVWRAFSKAGDVRKTLEDSLGQLQKVYAKDPFPSRNNVAAITNDTHRLREWNAALSRDLSTNESVAATNALTPSAFIQQLQHTVRELDAVAARNGGKVLADGFAYGFPQYLGAAGGMPKPEDVKRLDVQLRMVDAIMREMLAGHVSAISLAEREVFETGVEAVAPGAASVSRRGSRRAAPRATMTAAAPAAMGAYPQVFDGQTLNLIAAGEATGNIRDVLERVWRTIQKAAPKAESASSPRRPRATAYQASLSAGL